MSDKTIPVPRFHFGNDPDSVQPAYDSWNTPTESSVPSRFFEHHRKESIQNQDPPILPNFTSNYSVGSPQEISRENSDTFLDHKLPGKSDMQQAYSGVRMHRRNSQSEPNFSKLVDNRPNTERIDRSDGNPYMSLYERLSNFVRGSNFNSSDRSLSKRVQDSQLTTGIAPNNSSAEFSIKSTRLKVTDYDIQMTSPNSS